MRTEKGDYPADLAIVNADYPFSELQPLSPEALGGLFFVMVTLSFWTGFLFKIGYFLPGTVGAALIALVYYAAWIPAKGKQAL